MRVGLATSLVCATVFLCATGADAAPASPAAAFAAAPAAAVDYAFPANGTDVNGLDPHQRRGVAERRRTAFDHGRDS